MAEQKIEIHYTLIHGVVWGILGCLAVPFAWRFSLHSWVVGALLWLPLIPLLVLFAVHKGYTVRKGESSANQDILEGILAGFVFLILLFGLNHRLGVRTPPGTDLGLSILAALSSVPALFGLAGIMTGLVGIRLARRRGMSSVNFDFFMVSIFASLLAIVLSVASWILFAHKAFVIS